MFNEKSTQNTPVPRPPTSQMPELQAHNQQERRVQLQKKRQHTAVNSALAGTLLNASSTECFNDSLSLTPARPEHTMADISNTQDSLISLPTIPSSDVSF